MPQPSTQRARGAWRIAALLSGLAVLALAGSSRGAEEDFFKSRLEPFLTKHCLDCHSGDEPAAKLNLDAFKDAASVRGDHKTWGKVVDYLEAGIMPPEDQQQPAADEVLAVTGWVSGELAKFDDSGRRNPGRVTIRRLNRVEYANTVRDLIGVDFKPADDFPSDDVGYGFDNIGDVLTLPPLLMEKYLAAAEKIATQAIVSGKPTEPITARFAAEKLRSSLDPADGKATGALFANGAVSTEFSFPAAGDYVLRASAFGEQAGRDACRMALRIDDKNAAEVDVPATAEKPAVYEGRLTVAAGKHTISAAFLNDYYSPTEADPAQRDRNLFVDYLELEGPIDHTSRLPESHRRILFREPPEDDAKGKSADPKEVANCAREILSRFATRAYRRPVTAEEVDRLMRVFDVGRQADEAGQAAGTFAAGIQLAVQAILVSPHFLFRVELDSGNDSDAPVQKLNDYQLASRLSYFLWSSMPDDELSRLAAAGELGKPENLAAQVNRMLADKKSAALVENFAGQWLQIRNLSLAAPDRARFKGFDDGLRNAMLKETEMFFESVLHEDRSVLDLIDADYTFLNEELAKHYGIEGVEGSEFRRITLTDKRRGGVLTQASVLTITSNPTRTSPVKRGKWIMEQLLGTPPPPPPPGVPELEQTELKGTLRQKMEQHRANAACAVCHNRMDPLGFAFENFDAIGRWRDRDDDAEIDPSGTLPGGQKFSGAAELRTILKSKPERFARNLARKMLTYALGRGLEPYDNQAIGEIAARMAADDYKSSSLVLAVVNSEPFRMRRGKGVE
ncbi:MAG TPA: DUF1592 domain-containing protein [Pirellulales bacterium]|jgi:hypothetical protein